MGSLGNVIGRKEAADFMQLLTDVPSKEGNWTLLVSPPKEGWPQPLSCAGADEVGSWPRKLGAPRFLIEDKTMF